MGLTFTKEYQSQGDAIILQALDGSKAVTVHSSSRALAEFGLPAIQQKASEKYFAKRTTEDGTVMIFTADFLTPVYSKVAPFTT